MTHVSWMHPGAMALMLAAAGAQPAAAQDPQSESQTSVVQRLVPDTGAWGTGATRELKCRGKPGIDLRIHQEQSPRDPRLVTMVLRYERPRETRAVSQEGMALVDHGTSVESHPGSCTWNSGGFPDVPPEPGVVYFDLPRDAQLHAPGARDTTLEVAAHYPDVESLPRYLSDSTRYWVFFVDDATHVSISFGRWPLGGAAPPVAMTPAPAPTSGFGGTLRGGTSSSSSPVRSGAAVTPGGPGGASTSRALLPDVRIWGVATAPGSRGVRLVFNTDRDPGVFDVPIGIQVQFSRQRPPWDSAARRWAYPPGWDSPWLADISRPEHGGFMAEPFGSLTPRERYYYLITVESTDRSLPPRQDVGSFVASTNPFAKAPPAPGPDPASTAVVGQPLRGDAVDVAGALRDQPRGAATAAGTGNLPVDSAAPATSRTRLPPDVRVWNVETTQGPSGVRLSFQTDRVWERSSSGVRVQFSTRPPAWEGGLLVSGAVESSAREVVTGWFEAEPHWHLQAGRRYYYLITVDSNDESRRPRQVTGSFLPTFER